MDNENLKEKKERGEKVTMERTVVLRQIDDNDYSPVVNDAEGSSIGSLVKKIDHVGAYEYKGEVVAVGKNLSEVSVGDIVHHGKHAGIVFTFDNENLLLVREMEICVVEKKH